MTNNDFWTIKTTTQKQQFKKANITILTKVESNPGPFAAQSDALPLDHRYNYTYRLKTNNE